MTFNKNYLFISLIAVFSFSINFHYANIGVMPNDNFVLYNGGYRVLNSYVPFNDYWLVTGPLLDYLNALFFLINGISWESYIIHSSLFNSLIALSTYFLLIQLKLNNNLSLFYSILFSLMMYPVVGTPFVDHHSTIFVILAYYLLIIGIAKNNHNLFLFIPLLMCLAFLSKQTPSVYGLICLLFIFSFYIFFNLNKFINIIKPLIYGLVLAFLFLVIFFYFTGISIVDFIQQYILFAKTIGSYRISNYEFNIDSIFVQYKLIYTLLFILIFFLFKLPKKFTKNKKDFFVIVSSVSLSLLLIFHQILTLNQIYIFFLIPFITALIHIYHHKIFKKNHILLYFSILVCIYAVGKYHVRFNEHRKFNELEKVNLTQAVDAKLLHRSLNGLKWITYEYPNAPNSEIRDLKEAMEIIKNDNRKKTLITAYQFIAPALSIYDYSPNQWHHPSVSFPIRGQKYFSVYKRYFINSLKKNNIEIIYIIGKKDRNILNLILSSGCFNEEKVGNIIYKNELLKKCEDFR